MLNEKGRKTRIFGGIGLILAMLLIALAGVLRIMESVNGDESGVSSLGVVQLVLGLAASIAIVIHLRKPPKRRLRRAARGPDG